MYCLTDEQIEYILNDIRRNGVEMEDLQLNLLDHICCIVEQQLEDDGDFERFYQETIRQFYKKELREIEVETIYLLTYKNYYGMKRTMIVTGAFSAVAFIFGSFFKVMHWPGANILLVLAIVSVGLIFLPLLVLLKTKEQKSSRDKVVTTIAAVTGILFSMSILFTVMHWEGANMLWFTTIGTSMFLLIPTYFFTGIRNPETKTNTIVTTVLMIAMTGLTFTMLRVHRPKLQLMDSYAKNEQLLKNMQQRIQDTDDSLVRDINNICTQMKADVLMRDIGTRTLPENTSGIYVEEVSMGNYPTLMDIPQQLAKLKSDFIEYNNRATNGMKLPVDHVLFNLDAYELRGYSNFYMLNNLTQLQMFLAEAESNKLALK
jgi:hypothetical protein